MVPDQHSSEVNDGIKSMIETFLKKQSDKVQKQAEEVIDEAVKLKLERQNDLGVAGNVDEPDIKKPVIDFASVAADSSLKDHEPELRENVPSIKRERSPSPEIVRSQSPAAVKPAKKKKNKLF